MTRIDSVDVFRLLAILAVIGIHAAPVRVDGAGEMASYFHVGINQLSRFAVPFFFVISGYFWGAKIRGGADVVATSLKTARRIGVIFVAWSLIYLVPLNLDAFHSYGLSGPLKAVYWRFENLLQDPVSLIFNGTKFHLWFLPSLLCALIVCATFVHLRQSLLLLLLSVGLYLFALLTRPYVDTPLGVSFGFNTRNGPFISTLLFATGYFLSAHRTSEKWLFYGFLIFSCGAVMHLMEVFYLWSVFGVHPNQDFVVGTYFMGTGMAMAALSNHGLVKIKALGQLGRITLGIYASHLIFVEMLKPVFAGSDFWVVVLGYVAAVFILSVLFCLLLMRNQVTRKIVL